MAVGVTLICGGNISTRRVCVQNTLDNYSVLQATGALTSGGPANLPIGISSTETEYPSGTGQDPSGYAGQTGYVGMRLYEATEKTQGEAGAPFPAGPVMSDANGRLIQWVSGNFRVGFALQACTACLQYVDTVVDPV